ncbi:MAG: VOC family protein [Pseudomonadota bacterium]|nr:VOC family protein [Pseudomonadota bacterium]
MPVHELFPYLRVRGASEAITFYARAFGAVELFRLTEPGGRVGHAEITIDGHTVMISDEYPEYGINGPASLGGVASDLHLHVDNADEALQRAVDAGATLVRPATDQFYGERSGRVRDPFGHEWTMGHSIETLTHEEMQRRFNALYTPGE